MANIDNQNSSCSFAVEMVSYLYDEIGKFDRAKFELHLSDCQACTDEFAELSNARFSVYEWQKLEFAQLETQEIRIPYTLPTRKVSENAGLWSWLSFSPRFAVAGLAAVVVITFAIAAVTFGIFDNDGGGELAGVLDEKPAVERTPNERPQIKATHESGEPNLLTDYNVKLPLLENDIELPVKSEKIVANQTGNRRRVSGTPIPQDRRALRKIDASRPLKSRAPRLNEFEDDADETLRLADMFEDIETSDRS